MYGKLNCLAESWPYSPFRHYRFLTNEQKQQLTMDSFSQAKHSKLQWIVEQDKGEAVALLSDLEWDTNHFGIRMGSVDNIISSPDTEYHHDVEIKSDLVRSVIEKARDLGLMHLTFKIDAEDHAAIAAAHANGFALADTSITMLYQKKTKPYAAKEIYSIRDSTNDDLDVLFDMAKDSFTSSRFFRDPNIPNRAAAELYREWIDIYAREYTLFVTKRSEEITGFMSYRINEQIKKLTGAKIIGRGLSGVRPDAKGAYIQLVSQTMKNVQKEYDAAEFDGSICNHEVVNIWFRLGLSWVRSRHIFHLWLG